MSDQQPAPGWYPDPVQRHAERYWDGQGWTARIRDGVVEAADPHWEAPAAPAEGVHTYAAASAAAGGSSGTGGASSGAPFDRAALVTEVGRPRPAPSAREVLAATGGVIALAGLMVLIGWMLMGEGDGGRGEAGILGVIALACAYAWALVGPKESRAAGLGGAVVGPLLIVGAVFGADDAGRGSLIAAGVTLTVVWGAMFAGPGFTGSPILLAGSVLSAWGALLAVATTSGGSDPYSDPYYGSNDPFGTNPFDLAATVGIISLIFAFVCVAVAGIADSRGAKVLGTPLLAVAVIQSWVGLSAASTNGVGVAFLSVLVGGAFVVVGAAGERRGSLWIGAITATSGLASLVIQSIDEPVGGGVLLLGLGAIVVVASPAIDSALRPRTPAEVPQGF